SARGKPLPSTARFVDGASPAVGSPCRNPGWTLLVDAGVRRFDRHPARDRREPHVPVRLRADGCVVQSPRMRLRRSGAQAYRRSARRRPDSRSDPRLLQEGIRRESALVARRRRIQPPRMDRAARRHCHGCDRHVRVLPPAQGCCGAAVERRCDPGGGRSRRQPARSAPARSGGTGTVTVVFAIVLILAVAAFVISPLLARDGETVAEAPGRRGELWAREKAVAVLAITEADFDRATGKLSDDDYRV